MGQEIAANLWMGTFHSIFSKILRFEAEKLGYTSSYTIYDTQDSKNMIKTLSLIHISATQMGKYNIRCNAIAPGLVLTPAALNNLPEETRKIFARHNALPYLGQPQDLSLIHI